MEFWRPWWAGQGRPRLAVPVGACDSHHHIYDGRYPALPGAALRPGDASVADYHRLRQRLGLQRSVVVQPSTYGCDNRLLLEALESLGDSARGIAVVRPEVAEAELQRLHRAGVRGLRFNLAPAGTTTLDMVAPLARRIAGLGWHVQVNAPAACIVECEALWRGLPVPVVFDHLAHVPHAEGRRHAAFGVVAGLLQAGRAWVKLSGFYQDAASAPPGYAAAVDLAAAFAAAAPERLVWGSDWPHPTEQPDRLPDDAQLLDAFADAVPDGAVRHRILVDNPARLYGF